MLIRPWCSIFGRVKEVFLVHNGRCRGQAISVRGIQKRLEHYARQARLKVSCHQLRHTMATQLLNADAALVIIQDLLGHTRIKTTQHYCRASNLKVQRESTRPWRWCCREQDECNLDDRGRLLRRAG